MTRTVTDIDDHNPLPDAGVRIVLSDDTRIVIDQFSQTKIKAQHETASMLPQTITDDPRELREIIDQISDNLPDDVERTTRRLIRLDAWLDDRDTDNSTLTVHGKYRSLRPSQNQLVLVEEGSERICDKALPFVASLHKPAWSDRNQSIKSRLNKILKKWTLRETKSDGMYRGKVEDIKNGSTRIVATKFQTVASLAEAERIVNGEPRVPSNDSPDTSETTDQSSLNSF